MAVPFTAKLKQVVPVAHGEQSQESAHVEPMNVNLPTSPGIWDDGEGGQDTTRLRLLANRIESESKDVVHSIPTPWARAMLFRRALLDYDKGHELHDRVVGEWRGLLAILALKEVRRFVELGAYPIRVDKDQATRGTFRHSIAQLLPRTQHCISPKADWKLFHILSWEGVKSKKRKKEEPKSTVFAMTSPTTLVAVGANYDKVLDSSEVPWFKGDRLMDPCNYLSARERELLAEWLLHVREGLPQKGDEADSLGKRLLQFARDLNSKVADPRPVAEVFSEASIGLDGVELYREINHPIKPDATVVTNCAIVTDAQDELAASSHRFYLLVDAQRPEETVIRMRANIQPGLAHQMELEEREIVIHKMVTMATAHRELPGMATNRAGVFPAEGVIPAMHWCTAEFFFERDLILDWTRGKSDGGDGAFPECLSIPAEQTSGRAEGRHVVLPIRPQVLNLFKPSTLIKNLRLDWQANGEVRFRLKLQLQTWAMGATPVDKIRSMGAPVWVTLERTYGESEMIRANLPNLPVACVWPNFAFPNEVAVSGGGGGTKAQNRWMNYYLFESWSGLTQGPDHFALSPLPQDVKEKRPPLVLKEADEKGHTVREHHFNVTLMRTFPKALVCSMPRNEKRVARPDDESPAGLLLLKEPVWPVTQYGQRAVLGIDFGTTGTAIYRSMTAIDIPDHRPIPERLIFHDRMMQITGGDADTIHTQTRDLFLPSVEPADGKILSLFQDFGQRDNRQALLDGHVLFLRNTAEISDFALGDPRSIKTDLKWSEDANNNQAAQDFLVQLCIQSLAELVAAGAVDVELRYSYPTAFSERDLGYFKGLWGTVLNRLKEVTSVKVSLPKRKEDGNDLGEHCEAIAATRFFSHMQDEQQMVVEHGAITLDIGGGTTDIAIWNRNDSGNPALLAHTSIRFAGQDIFQRTVSDHSEIMAILLPQLMPRDEDFEEVKHKKLEFLEGLKSKTSASRAQLDSLITTHGRELLDRVVMEKGKPGVADLLQVIELGLCGIGFYTGLLVGKLIKDEQYTATRSRIPIFIGGNGSQLFKWSAEGEDYAGSEIVRQFGRAFLAGGNYASDGMMQGYSIRVGLSSRPKQEVAFGLVMPPEDLERNDQFVNPMAGENYLVGPPKAPVVHQWDTSPDLQTLGSVAVGVDPELPVFRAFLKAMNLTPTVDQMYSIATAVDSGLKPMKKAAKQALEASDHNGKAQDPVRKEPLFILALKRLIGDRISRFPKVVPGGN